MKVLTLVSRQRYEADDYDEDGNLKAPMWFWVTLLWLLLPWWVTVIGMAQKVPLAITQVLYPTLIDNVIGLLASAPAILICLIYPIRGKYPRWGYLSYFALLVLGGLEIIYQGYQPLMSSAYAIDGDSSLLLSVLCFNLAALLSVVFSSRLHCVFLCKKQLM